MLLISEIRKKIKNKRREPWRTTSKAMEAPNHAHGHGGVSYMAVEVVYSRVLGVMEAPIHAHSAPNQQSWAWLGATAMEVLHGCHGSIIFFCVCARACFIII